MKKILSALACLCLLFTISCSSKHDEKSVPLDADPEMLTNDSYTIDKDVKFGYDYLSKEESGKAFDKQNWFIILTVDVKKNITDIVDCRYIKFDVTGKDGKEISGLTGFEFSEESLKECQEWQKENKTGKIELKYVHQTENSHDYKDWMKEASGVKATM